MTPRTHLDQARQMLNRSMNDLADIQQMLLIIQPAGAVLSTLNRDAMDLISRLRDYREALMDLATHFDT